MTESAGEKLGLWCAGDEWCAITATASNGIANRIGTTTARTMAGLKPESKIGGREKKNTTSATATEDQIAAIARRGCSQSSQSVDSTFGCESAIGTE